MSLLTGDERLSRHMSRETISLNELKAFLGTVTDGTGTVVSDTIMTLPSDHSLSGHRVVASVSGSLVYASRTNLDCINNVIGILKDAVTAGEVASIQYRGYMDEPSWTWQLDKPIFVGLDGYMTQVPPSVGFSQQIATVISATRILINIQEPIVIGD